MNISINAPSYKRPKGVLTLDYLPMCKIWVDESEAEEYRMANPGATIISCPKGVQGNLCRVRNYILETEFAAGADVVLIIDDDLQYIARFAMNNGFGYEVVKVDAKDIYNFIAKYSILADDLGAKFWGLNCNNDNMAYRHCLPFSTTAYIGGPFQCFLKGNRCKYDERLPLKEDYDMTLQQLNLERVVLRVNSYHYVCKQSVQAGGCATYRNRLREAQQFEALRKKWGGDIIKRDKSNKGRSSKERIFDDYNPILKSPIKGV